MEYIEEFRFSPIDKKKVKNKKEEIDIQMKITELRYKLAIGEKVIEIRKNNKFK